MTPSSCVHSFEKIAKIEKQRYEKLNKKEKDASLA